MQPNPDKTQEEKDQGFLLGLLLVPVKRSTRAQRLNTFFSHPAWQSAGAIIGLLSLIVTIILTIYVFNLSQNQQTSHISTIFYTIPGDEEFYWRVYMHVQNSGPAKIEALDVSTIIL